TVEQSYFEIDLTLGFPFRYGMGFMLGADWFSPYGPYTRHAYGHIGFTNILCWADPDRRVAVGLLTSGKPLAYPPIHYLLPSLAPRSPTSSPGSGRSASPVRWWPDTRSRRRGRGGLPRGTAAS